MRDYPNISTEAISERLRAEYSLEAANIRFLPIGYDLNAAVYEAICSQGETYFVKARRGEINLAGLMTPRALIEHGIPNILAPLRTLRGELFCRLDERVSLAVFPFIRGDNATAKGLTDSQWVEFGMTLNAVHSGGFASRLAEEIPNERFDIPSAPLVLEISAQIQELQRDSPAEQRLIAYWNDNAATIRHIVERATLLGRTLQTQSFEFVLCHSDIHFGNILVAEDGRIYLVDWDTPLLAPRERDLLFVVGSMIAGRVQPRQEALFVEGYGATNVNLTALAYYRYERAIQDIGECAKSVLFDGGVSEEMKTEEVDLFISHFQPGEIIEAAMEADRQQEANRRKCEGAFRMTIREANQSDAVGMGRVLVDTFMAAHRGQIPEEDWEARKQNWTHEVSAKGWEQTLRNIANSASFQECIYVAEGAEGDIIGVSMAYIEASDRAAEVCALYVHPDCQGQGVGRGLLQAIAARLKENNITTLRIGVLETNAPARRFYEAMGGQVILKRDIEEAGHTLRGVVYGWESLESLTA